MSITEQHRKELVSRCFVQSIASGAGLIIDSPELDYGVDGTFRSVVLRGRRRICSGRALDFQLKATTQWSTDNGGMIKYRLESRTFNDLIDRNKPEHNTCRMILIVCCLQPDGRWLKVDTEELSLRDCCYYWKPTGSEEYSMSNYSSKTIGISKKQLLTPEILAGLMV